MAASLARLIGVVLRRLRLRGERDPAPRAMTELQALSDHELEDIGLRRCELCRSIQQGGQDSRRKAGSEGR